MAQDPVSPETTESLNPPLDGKPMPERETPPPGIVTPPWRLRLQVLGEKQATVGLQVRERMLVGRGDPNSPDELDLDLTPYGGLHNGVSRLHATITYSDGLLYIEDLESTNGTRINGFRLTPHHAYRLRDGDELEFGRIRVIVRFVRASR